MSLPTNNRVLANQLRVTLSDLDQQIAAIKDKLQKQIDVMPYPEATTIWMIHDSQGNYPLATLLAAKAQVLAAMVALQPGK